MSFEFGFSKPGTNFEWLTMAGKTERDRRRSEASATLRLMWWRGRRFDGQKRDRSVHRAWQWHVRESERNECTPEWVLKRCLDDVARDCAALKVRYEPVVRSATHAYVFYDRNVIEGPPIKSRWGYMSAKHELGHVARRQEHQSAQHKTVQAEDDGRICVRCEINAWLWAKSHSVIPWDAEMQASLADGLRSYLPYATPDEFWELHELMESPLAQKRRRLRESVSKG